MTVINPPPGLIAEAISDVSGYRIVRLWTSLDREGLSSFDRIRAVFGVQSLSGYQENLTCDEC